MAGFNVVGSAPVASIPSGGGGTFYGPGVGNITLGGMSLSANVSPVYPRFIVRESLVAPASARVFPRFIAREILHSSVNTARVNAKFIVREMLIATYVAPSGGGFVSILW